MDIQKLELLIKKIDQAVKVIQRLKNSEIKYQEEIKTLKTENAGLLEEKLFFQKEVETLKKESQSNSILHKELESKIIEIIKCLPDEDEETSELINDQTQQDVDLQEIGLSVKESIRDEESSDEHKVVVEKDETEEEMLKSFVRSQEIAEDGSLFNNEPEASKELKSFKEELTEEIEKPKELFEEFPKSEENKFDEIKNKFEFDFNKALIEEEEKEEIDFNFEDNKKNDDLPKGVL